MKRKPARKPVRQAPKPKILPHVETDLRVYRRDLAVKALAKIDGAQVLEEGDLLAIGKILRATLDGRDPRVDLGIAPKRGKPSNGMMHVFLAAHYWLLRESESKELVAAEMVKNFWGFDLSTVRRIAADNKAAANRLKRQYTPDQIIGIAELSVAHWQLRAKSGN